MEKFLEYLGGVFSRALVERPRAASLSTARTLVASARGGLVGGAIVVGLMGWLPIEFTNLKQPIDAMARALFGGLVCGVLGGLSMAYCSIRIHQSTPLGKGAWALFMLAVGGILLLGAHVLGAETDPERNWNFEWYAMLAHGAVASLVVTFSTDFRAIPRGLHCLVMAVIASLVGGAAYAGVTKLGLVFVAEGQFIWRRGAFVTLATIPYVASVLLPAFFARVPADRIERLVRQERS